MSLTRKIIIGIICAIGGFSTGVVFISSPLIWKDSAPPAANWILSNSQVSEESPEVIEKYSQFLRNSGTAAQSGLSYISREVEIEKVLDELIATQQTLRTLQATLETLEAAVSTLQQPSPVAAPVEDDTEPDQIAISQLDAYANLAYMKYLDTSKDTSLYTKSKLEDTFVKKGIDLDDLDDVSVDNPTTGQVLKWNGTKWVASADNEGSGDGGGGGGDDDGEDADTTYTAGSGLSLAGTTFNLGGSLTGNATIDLSGFSLAFNNGSFTVDGNHVCDMSGNCGDEDTNTTYTAGSGLSLAGTTFSLGGELSENTVIDLGGFSLALTNGSLTIGGNQVCDSSGNCGDEDTNTTYTAGSGLSLAGTTFSLGGDLTGNTELDLNTFSLALVNGTLTIDGNHVCDMSGNCGDEDTNTTYTAGSGLSLAGTTFSLGGELSANTEIDLNSFSLALVNGELTIDGNQVCNSSGNCSSGSIWENTDNVYHPGGAAASVADLVIGGNSTASAKFTVKGLTGNVGIGTINPIAPLVVAGSTSERTWLRVSTSHAESAAGIQLANSNGRFASFQYSSSEYAIGEVFSIYTQSDRPMSFGTNGENPNGGTSAITFTPGGYNNQSVIFAPTGNVGIGTSSPSKKLHIVPGVEDGGILLDGAGLTGTNRVVGLRADAESAIRYAAGDGPYVPHFLITGMSYPSNGGRISFRYNHYIAFDHISGEDYLERMRISSAGNVGIGTNDPSQLLDVNGNARFRSVGTGGFSSELNITSDGTLTTTTSDIRMKTNITAMRSELDKVLKLKPSYFNWKEDPTGKKDIGFIAQEVAPLYPEVVFTNPHDGFLGINYNRFIAVLTRAIQEQQALITKLSTKLDDALSSLSKAMEIADTIIFKRPVTFNEAATFSQPIKLNQDTAGSFIIPTDTTEVTITYTSTFSENPLLYVGFDQTPPDYHITNESETSFTITFESATTDEIELRWLAVLRTAIEESVVTVN